MSQDSRDIGNNVLYVPFGEMLTSIAKGIAEAQFALDKSSMTVAELMGGQRVLRDPNTGQPILNQEGKATILDSRVYFGHSYDADGTLQSQQLSMIELGFVPNFYHFVDTVINMKVAIQFSKSELGEYNIHSAPIDAHYASTYNYNLDFAATVQTKIVPIPPPAILEERIRLLMDAKTDSDKVERKRVFDNFFRAS